MGGSDPWADFPDANPHKARKSAHDWSEFPDAPPRGKQAASDPATIPPLSQTNVKGAVDGDTLALGNGLNLRLWGVDAPELKQPGYDRYGNSVPIGQQSRTALSEALLNSPAAPGAPVGISYGRPVAPVSVDGVDLGEKMARDGFALAAPEYIKGDPDRRFRYLQGERLARQNLLGIHKTRFQPPADFRRDPALVEMPERETIPMWWDTPTPQSGMRPEVETRFVQMMNDPKIPVEEVARYAKENGGFIVDPVELARNREVALKSGKPIGLGYKDAEQVLTDPGDGAFGAATRGFGNGVLPNMLEETGALFDTAGLTPGRENLWNSDRRFADIWANNNYQNESITGFDAYAHPWATTGGQIAGGLVDAYLFPGGGAASSAANLAKFGAGYGFVSGFGRPGNVPQRLGSGMVGMAEGVITNVLGGKALEAAAPYVGKALSPVTSRLAPVSARISDAIASRLPGRIGRQAEAMPMAAEASPSISQEGTLPAGEVPSRPQPISQPLGGEQMRNVASDLMPSDVLPIPSNQVGSVQEAAAIDAGRFRPATAPNERGELTRQTLKAWNGAEVPKVGPVDLVGWLRLRGGLQDQGGELSHMGLGNAARTGMDFVGQEARFGPLVNNQSGMTLDDAALQAWERGYFPGHTERPTVNEFLDALRGTHEGWDRKFLPDDLPQIERFNAARDERFSLEQQQAETGQPVYVDRSVPANEPQPFAPPEAYQEWLAGGPDFAGNINLNKFETPQDIKRALDFTERRVGFDAATRGRVAQAETERLASELNMTPEQLLARRKGQAFNAEEALAARQILAKSGNELVNFAKRVRSMDEPGDEVLAEFRKAWMRHAAIQEQVTGATAEAGRALAQFKMLANSRAVRKDVLTSLVEGSGGRDNLKNAANVLLDTLETAPGKFNTMAEQLAKPRFKDKAIELYYNMMLSGPQTHVVNVTSNTLTALGQIPEHGAAAMIGKAREAFAKGAIDRVTSSEVGQRAFGMVAGFKDGLRQFARTARTGETSDLLTKVELQSQHAISGLKGDIIRTPSRFLAAEDELFKAVARRMELNGQAARIVHKEGLKGADAAKRIAELVNNPTDDMLARSLDYGRYLTFQRPLGPVASKVAAMRNGNPLMTLLIPFVRTPTNILKFAAERSPAAPLLKEWRADFLAGGARRDLAIAKVLVGTGFGASIYEMAANGLVSGSVPSDPIKAQFMRADGWQPYSFKIGDKWYSYSRLDPFATTIGVAADLATKADGMSAKQLDDYAMLLTASIIKNMGDKTWLSGTSDFINAIDDPERYGKSYLRKMAAGLVTPALSAQVARTVDPVARDVRSLPDAIMSRIPFASRSLPAKRDIWGQPITNEGGLGPDVISPIWQSTVKNDPLNAEMLRIGARFDSPERYIKQDGKRIDLTPQQYEQYSAQAGQNTRTLIEKLMASPSWRTMSDETKAAAVKKAATKGKADARQELFGKGAKPADPWDSFPDAGKTKKADPWGDFKDVPQRNIVGELQQAIPGVGITSGYRTPEYQADMKRRGYHPASNSAHLDGGALDLEPPKGKSMGWLQTEVRRLYPDAVFNPEGDHLHVTFPGWYGAPAIGGAAAAGLVNPNGAQ